MACLLFAPPHHQSPFRPPPPRCRGCSAVRASSYPQADHNVAPSSSFLTNSSATKLASVRLLYRETLTPREEQHHPRAFGRRASISSDDESAGVSCGADNGNGGDGDGGGSSGRNGGGGGPWRGFDPLPPPPEDSDHHWRSSSNGFPPIYDESFFATALKAALASAAVLILGLPLSSLALHRAVRGGGDGEEGAPPAIWEVRGGRWERVVWGASSGGFSGVDLFSGNHIQEMERCWHRCREFCLGLLFPEGFPRSVTSDYLEYSLWRGVQGIASQVNAVLATQALLKAVGLGKGAIPAAATVNWVLKDGIGYLSKILLSKFGRHFDVNPKGWRLFADLMENAAYGLEVLTPVFPHNFVLIGAAAGAGRSAAALIQAASRSCFYASFAAQRNFAEVIAKGEAQGMVSKFFGIMLGVALANYIGSSIPLTLITFAAVTGFHMYCNFKSYQSIQLRTLNPYRASLVFSEYLFSGQVPSIGEVNDAEPLCLISTVNGIHGSEVLSVEAKDSAPKVCARLHLGSKLSQLVNTSEDANALFDLFQDEGYMVAVDNRKFCVVMKEGCSPQDMLKALFHVNYLYWLENNMGAATTMEARSVADDCKPGGTLQVSLDYVRREFMHVRTDGSRAGWDMEGGLVARPSPDRIRSVSPHG